MKFKFYLASLLFLTLTISCKKQEKKTDVKYFNYSGTYNSLLNKNGISIGQLIIKQSNNTEINFEIITGTQSGCTGELKGIAKFNAEGIANHKSIDCKNLTFKFKNNLITLEEKNCDMHGIKCSFAGTYKK